MCKLTRDKGMVQLLKENKDKKMHRTPIDNYNEKSLLRYMLTI